MRKIFFHMRVYLILVMVLGLAVSCHGQNPHPVSYGLWAVDISADEKYVAAGGDDSLLQILTADLKPVKVYKQNGMIKSVDWHPSENKLAVATIKNAFVLDTESGEEIKLEGVKYGSRAIAWNPSGELLGMADGGGIFMIWNKQGQLLRRIQKSNPDGTPDKKSFLGFDWHPFNNTMVTVGDEIRIYDTSGNQINVFRHRKEMTGILSVKWHPSGEFFVTGDYGHENEGKPTVLQFWKPDGTLIRELKDSDSEFRSVSWNKEGTRLATGSSEIRIRDKEGKILYRASNKGNAFWCIRWNKLSDKLITVNNGGRSTEQPGNIRIWTPEARLLKSVQ